MDRLKIIVDNRLRFNSTELPPELVAGVKESFEHPNPKYFQLKRMGLKWTRGERPTIVTWQQDRAGLLTLPRGGRGTIGSALSRAGIQPEFDDQTHGGTILMTKLEHDVELWDFQRELVEVARDNLDCLWRSPPGSGKTTAALAYACGLGVPTLVVVPTGNLLDQWLERCRDEVGLHAGVIRSGRHQLAQITVATQQTMRNHVDRYAKAFGCVIMDEAQRAAANTFQQVIDSMHARRRLGITADERRADGKQALIYDQFGPVLCEVSRAELESRGFIHDVEIRVVPTSFEAPWYLQLDPDVRPLHADKLYSQMAQDEPRNVLAKRCADQFLHEGEQVAVLTLRREHCHNLLTRFVGIGAGRLMGSDEDAAEFERTRQGLKSGEIRVAVGTYQASGVGFDVQTLSRGVFAMPVANSQAGRSQWFQFRGRFARRGEGKAGAVITYLWDREVYGLRPLRNLVRWNRKVQVEIGRRLVNGRDYLHEQQALETKDDSVGGLFR